MKLPKTRIAIKEFDEQIPVLEQELNFTKNNDQCMELIVKMEKLGEAVGIAFGEDTKELNNPETCRQCIRPGPPVAAPGFELSFVRRMLLKEAE